MFDHWTLKKRLTLTFAAILALTSVLMGVALLNNGKLRDTVKWNTHTYQVLAESNSMLLNMVNIETGMRGFVAGGNENFLEPFTKGSQGFGVAFEKAKSLTSDNPAQQGRLERMLADHKQFMEVANNLLTVRRNVTLGKEPLDDLLREFSAGKDKVAMDAFRAEVADFAKAEQDLLVVRSAALDSTMSATDSTLLFGGLVLFALTGALGLLLTRSVFRQLGAEPSVAAAAVNAVAQGDLTVDISVRPGDNDSLLAALARMRDSLVSVVTAVRGNSESVATASAQIAQGNQDLSGRTEQQASALQQTAATMEELGSTVRNNSDSAKQANQLAQGASVVAARGGEVVGQVVTTMQGINDSSRQIGEIISVIDGIAFQTNILALNAAVEAARAGEQGRGFAVVASEVRSLAHRSAEAAKEIKSLIGRSVEQVEKGTALVDQAGQTMDEIVSSIRRVTDIVAEISAASVEQSSGVQQVGEAVSQMDQATQQNAALVEESAAAAESLKTQANQLVQAVAVFKLTRQESSGSRSGAATPAANARHIERRSPDRALNVTRPQFKAKPAPAVAQSIPSSQASVQIGTDNWETF
ncbi:MAG: chemotaxis protein [Burkholderiales bacterium 28-67-8]|nr:MAG: chemotaxis protein [Burkholderiales bacterium 28-67-8]